MTEKEKSELAVLLELAENYYAFMDAEIERAEPMKETTSDERREFEDEYQNAREWLVHNFGYDPEVTGDRLDAEAHSHALYASLVRSHTLKQFREMVERTLQIANEDVHPCSLGGLRDLLRELDRMEGR